MLSLTNRLTKCPMARAESYEEWRSAAQNWDKKRGKHRWKSRDSTRHYDFVAIRMRLDQLRKCQARGDDRGLLFALNEGLHGNMAGMGNPSLYNVSKFGTKQLIEDYVKEIVAALETIASSQTEGISKREKLDFFRRASHCFGKSGLMMSGSSTLLFFHVGVLKALSEENVLPDIISGSSGGALMGAVVASQTAEELQSIFEPGFLTEVFQGALPSSKIGRTRLYTVEQLRGAVDQIVPDITFSQASSKTGRSMDVSVAPAEKLQTSRLLSAITSPDVCLREAVMASMALPGLFPPVMLEAKNPHGQRQPYLPTRRWIDGSVSDDLPAKRLARLYGVNHYIVSQTNPHIIPFVTDGKNRKNIFSVLKHASLKTTREWLNAGAWVYQKQFGQNSITNNKIGTLM